jgi:hypothetical protein
MSELRLPSALENSQCVLVAGAGGGFDVYAGLPIYERLRSLGKKVFLANLSFVCLGDTNAQSLTQALYAVEPTTTGADVFSRAHLGAVSFSPWGECQGFAFEKMGVRPVREGYTHLVQSLNLDAIVLRDPLHRHAEGCRCHPSTSTPAEDMTSLAAVAAINVPTRIVACVRFGVDAYHGVCHAN